jgi:hypothetical protein
MGLGQGNRIYLYCLGCHGIHFNTPLKVIKVGILTRNKEQELLKKPGVHVIMSLPGFLF